MRDEVLRALGDPGEVADTELVRPRERRRQCQPRWIGKSTRSLGRKPSYRRLEPRASDRLGLLQVEAEKIATVIARHEDILTFVDALSA